MDYHLVSFNLELRWKCASQRRRVDLSSSLRLIVVACLVEFGEVLARLIVNSTEKRKDANFPSIDLPISKENAMAILERMMQGSKL